ncbi:hypothetical protein [Paludibacterium sp. B53371]|uniref:hypothetical protein n=1 Tax=Paludibacterium sp. B53371 TaxID=2806263 RepID=UPI001C045897|nr:hypothetical protein [Paludibacterium sp. B53371]
MLVRLFYACNGLIGYLSKLLIAALEIRLERGYRSVEPWMLEEAFSKELWNEGVGPLNPFNKRFQWRVLNKAGELFAPTSFTAPSSNH